MPHECTTCGRQFDDGSKEMLSGCPNCGGNTFQFQPPDRDSEPDQATPTAEPDGSASTPEPDADGESRDAEPQGAEIADETGVENSAQRDARSAAAGPDEIDEARRGVSDAESGEPSDTARTRGTPQGPPADASSEATPEEFDLSGAVGPEDDEPVEKQPVAGSAPEREEPTPDDDADLGALREELNQQFESIKITAPGQYELNLMELYDRKEYIISLQEDGRYVIEMADDYGIDD